MIKALTNEFQFRFQTLNNKPHLKQLIITTSDPPRLRTGAMLILKCFSTIAYSLPREMGYLTLK
jgi:hypothetical protein